MFGSGDECPHPVHEYDHDPTLGITTCGRCGQVMEGGHLRTDNAFENATAKKPTRYQPRQRNLNYDLGSGASRMQTLETAKMELNTLAFRLKTAQAITSGAARLYSLALDRRIQMGLRREVSLATCMYIQCRLEQTTHLLYEFAEAVGEDVSSMQATYVRFCVGLRLQIPPLDPSVYMTRLAMRLELGEREEEILHHGEAILSSMRKEWIDYGRRPYGVVAAALLTACSICGEARSVSQLSQMVMLTEETIMKRLVEFSNTAEGRQEDATGKEVSAPPCTIQQSAPQALRTRIAKHEQRMVIMRSDLMRMLKGRTIPSPLASATWENYWTLREETLNLFSDLVLTGRPRKSKSDITLADRRDVAMQYNLPVYEGTPAPSIPSFGEQGMALLQRDIALTGGMPSRAHEKPLGESALKEAVLRTQECLVNFEASQGERDTKMKAEPDIVSVSEWDPDDDEYMVLDPEEVAERQFLFTQVYQEVFNKAAEMQSADTKPMAHTSSSVPRKKRTRGPGEETKPKPFEASGPGEAAAVAMSRRVSSGINKEALTNLLEGADDDIPMWGPGPVWQSPRDDEDREGGESEMDI